MLKVLHIYIRIYMETYDGAKVWYAFLVGELVGMLNKISEKYDENDIGLYRDDGLAVFKNISIKKNLQSLFKRYGLETIIECNKK